MTTKRRAVLVDVDGTVALNVGRDPYDWSRVSEDAPNTGVIAAVRAAATAGHDVVFVSGREDVSVWSTLIWIREHVQIVPRVLLMRRTGDRRQDTVVKRELYEEYIAPRYDVLYVIDDRQQVVDMWRDGLGLTVLQCAPGNF